MSEVALFDPITIKSKVFNTTPTSIDFIEGIRSPIRLGAEVFNSGKLSDQKLNELSKTLKKYQKIFIMIF